MTTNAALIERLLRAHDHDCWLHNLDDDTRSCDCSWMERKECADALAAADAEGERLRHPTAMDEAIAAGDGTLHGAIDHWHDRATRAEAERDDFKAKWYQSNKNLRAALDRADKAEAELDAAIDAARNGASK